MRIGVLYKPDFWNVAYRAVGPAEALRRRGHHVDLVVQRPDFAVDLDALRRCDVVHIYRRGDTIVQRCVNDLRAHGVGLTWDNDDDVRLVPPERLKRLGVSAYGAQRDFQHQVKMMRRSHVVTTTSEHLAERYRQVGAPVVRRIENYLAPHQYVRFTPPHNGLVIGWVAGEEHVADARALRISQVLQEVLDRHLTARVVTVGVRLDLDPARYVHHAMIPFEDLPQTIAGFDVAIAPLGDVPMSYARSNVKVKEYAAAGVPWLASARGPYRGLGPEQGGVLVADDGWQHVLGRVLGSVTLRENLRTRATRWAATQSIDRHADEWIGAFEEARAAAQAGAAATR